MHIARARKWLTSDVAVGLGLALLLLAFRGSIQELTTVGQGLGWDGSTYSRMTDLDHLRSGAELPFGLRVGLPLLASTLAGVADALSSFRIINLLGGALFGVLSYLLIRKVHPDAHPLTSLVGWALMNVGEVAPIPFTFWYPVNTDVLFDLMILGTLFALLIPKRSIVAVPSIFVLFVAGTLVRENFTVNAALVALYGVLDMRAAHLRFDRGRRGWSMFGAAVAGTLVGSLSVFALTGHWIFADKTTDFLVNVMSLHLTSTVAAVLNVYGPAMLLVLAGVLWSRGRLSELRLGEGVEGKASNLLVFLVLATLVAFGGGGNIERFLWWYLPIVVLLALPFVERLVRDRRWLPLTLILVLFAVVQRAFVSMEAGGTGIYLDRFPGPSCDYLSAIQGSSPFLGHWVQICGPGPSVLVPELFGIAVLILLALHFVSVAADTKLQEREALLRRIEGAIGVILLVAAAATGTYLASRVPPGIHATASGVLRRPRLRQTPAPAGPELVLDSDETTEWGLPTGQVGWLEISADPPVTMQRLRILNGHDPRYGMRAVRSATIELYRGDELALTIEASWDGFRARPVWTEYEVGLAGVDRVRVEIHAFYARGAAIAEIAWE